MLRGSTASITMNGRCVTKTYHPAVTPLSKRIEIENLEWAYELGLPVVKLLTVGYEGEGDDISYIITSLAQGYTINELYSMGYVSLAQGAMVQASAYQQVAQAAGLHLPNLLETDGNIRVQLDGTVTMVDVGDSY